MGSTRSLAIALDLESKGAAVRKGTLIDATMFGSASKGDDPRLRFCVGRMMR
jgi:hypothetical protein